MLEGPRRRLAAVADGMSLTQQITLAIGALAVASLTILASVAASISRDAAVARITAEMRETALSFASELEKEMRERFADLTLLAAATPMRRLWQGDPATLRTALEELAFSMGHEAWVGFVQTDGTVTSATRGLGEAQSLAAEPWFREALEGPTFRDIRAGGSDLAAGDARSFRPATLLALPVKQPDGKAAGALVARLSLDQADAIRQGLIGAAPDDPDDVWLLSRAGRMLFGPRPGSQPYSEADIAFFLQQKSGTLVEGKGSDAILTGFAVVDGDERPPFIDWIVVARQPAGAAFAEAEHLAFIILGVGFAVLLATLAVILMLARHVARPLRRLAAVADQMGRAGTAENLPRVRGSREIIRLSGALRALLRRLGAAEALVSTQSARHAEDLDALRALADTDPLTGLLNRRAFRQAAARALAGTRATDKVGVLMVDIDHFKTVNDTFGHATGDKVLEAVGRAVAALVRDGDRAARFGGEEFVILCLDVTPADIGALAERLRTGIAAAPIPLAGLEVSITASVGATLASPLDRDIDDVIERADMALYAAKRAGRNRVEVQLTLDRLTI